MTHAQSDDSDEALMRAYADGAAEAFAPLYARHKGGVYRYMLRQLQHGRAGGVADELAQDVWMKLIDARARYTTTAKFTTWLYTIAHNRLMDYFRASKVVDLPLIQSFADDAAGEETESAHLHVPASPADTPEARTEGRALATRLLDCLGALPANQREAFLLQEEAEMTLAQIAASCDVGIETAKSRLRYAMQRLRTCMQAYLV